MEKTVVCTVCPNGCVIKATYSSEEDFTADGNKCPRGLTFAKDECFDPKRVYTGTVRVDRGAKQRVPVRSTKPIPKDQLLACADALKAIHIEAPFGIYETVVKDIFGTGADIVTTMDMYVAD